MDQRPPTLANKRNRPRRLRTMKYVMTTPICLLALLQGDHGAAAWSASPLQRTSTFTANFVSGPLVSRKSQPRRHQTLPPPRVTSGLLSLLSTTAVDTMMEAPEPSSSSVTAATTTTTAMSMSSSDEAVATGTLATMAAATAEAQDQQQQQQQQQQALLVSPFSGDWKEMLGINDLLALVSNNNNNSNMDAAQVRNKVINLLLLTASFGFALYQILNIDHGMTRGWTQSEIAMRIPMDTWAGYESALEDKPVATKTMINVVIYLLGDWLSQTVFQKRNILDFDAKRTLRNGFIGLCFGPLVHLYYEFSDTILPLTDGDLWTRGEKILMDQTIYLSVKCSIYIAAVSLLQGDSFDTAKDNVKGRLGGIVVTAWKFWPLVHCLTYSVIPSRHRILWVNMIDLIWNAILASMASKKVPSPDEEAALAQAKAAVLMMIEESSNSPLAEEIVPNVKEQQQPDDILALASQHEVQQAEPESLSVEQTQSEQLKNEEEDNVVLVQVISQAEETQAISMGPSRGNATMAATA